MSKNAFLGKLFSQIGIFVVSAFLAGILLLAIQANKLPGIKLDVIQADDEVIPFDDVKPEQIIEPSVEENYEIIFTPETVVQNNEPNKIIENHQNSIPDIDVKKQKPKNNENTENSIEKKPEAVQNHISVPKKQIAKTVSLTDYSKPDDVKKCIVTAAFSVSPMLFAGQSFISDYFQNDRFLFAPCGTIGISFPSKKIIYALYFSAVVSSLNLNAPNIYQSINLDFSTTLFLAKLDFSILHTVFSEYNLLEAHLGTGITFFTKPVCTVNELLFTRKNYVFFALDFGLAFRHFFTDRFFVSAACDITCILPYSDRLLIVQPILAAGLKL